MYEFIQSGELRKQARRLLRYRLPLVVVIVVNTALILRIALPPARQAQAQRPADRQLVAGQMEPDAQQIPPMPPPNLLALAGEKEAGVTNTLSVDSRIPLGTIAADMTALPAVGLRSATGRSEATSVSVPFDSTVMQQPNAPLANAIMNDRHVTDQPLGADPIDARVDVFETANQVEVVRSYAPEISIDVWRHDVQKLMRRWQQASQDLLSKYDAPVPDKIEPNAAIVTLGSRSPESAHVAPAATPLDAPVPSAVPNELTEQTRPAVGVTLHNAMKNAETIRFLIDHRLCELRPGELHQFPHADKWLIQYHRGGEFGNIERVLLPGVYEFVATEHGWDVVRVESAER